jgi:hypothetical protein
MVVPVECTRQHAVAPASFSPAHWRNTPLCILVHFSLSADEITRVNNPPQLCNSFMAARCTIETTSPANLNE